MTKTATFAIAWERLQALEAAEAERDALRAQLQAVTDLHQPDPDATKWCMSCDSNHPCPTFTAASAPGVGAAQTRTEET